MCVRVKIKAKDRIATSKLSKPTKQQVGVFYKEAGKARKEMAIALAKGTAQAPMAKIKRTAWKKFDAEAKRNRLT